MPSPDVALLHEALSLSVDLITVLDDDGVVLYASDAARAILGYAPEELLGTDALGLLHPESVEATREALARVLSEGEACEVVSRARRADGEYVWLESRARRSAEGERIVVVTRDISERRAHELAQARLARELDHRVKNTLAMVLALLRRSERPERTPTEQLAASRARVLAMARAHEELSLGSAEPPSMGGLVRRVLQPFLDEHLHLRFEPGAERRALPSRSVVPLALILHELAANSSRHGAWARGAGCVTLRCTADPQHLRLEWRETGVEGLVPPARRGTGLELIEGLGKNDLRADVEVRFESEGVVCELHIPL